MNNPKISKYGNKCWYNEKGERHRLDGPAVEWVNGYKEWYVNGQLHRLDGPAVEHSNGSKQWWVNNKRHRLDGPAIIWANGHKRWFIDGKRLTEEEFKKQRPIKLEPVINRFEALMDEE